MDTFNFVELQKELERDEGRRNRPYEDSEGIITIGVGWNLEENGLPEAIIDQLFNIATHRAIEDAQDLVTDWDGLSKARQRVLVNMAYNMGLTTLAKFRKMLKAVRERDFDKAADEMLDSKWARQVGDRATRLAKMMREG